MPTVISMPMADDSRCAYVVDDDCDVRVSLSMHLRSAGVKSRPFACADDFLAELRHLKPGVVVVDVVMPEKGGLSLLEQMREREILWPAIMMSGHGNVTTAVAAMKLGASEFLEKPFEHVDLFDALERGFADLSATVERDLERKSHRERLESLTPRQGQVLHGVLDGRSNKQMAARLNLSTRTVEVHRAAMMRALRVTSLGELVALVTAAAGYRRAE